VNEVVYAIWDFAWGEHWVLYELAVCAAALPGNTMGSLLSRVPLIPLRGTARLFYCLRPSPVRRLSYVQYKASVMFRT
jgi:hypothetical protein